MLFEEQMHERKLGLKITISSLLHAGQYSEWQHQCWTSTNSKKWSTCLYMYSTVVRAPAQSHSNASVQLIR